MEKGRKIWGNPEISLPDFSKFLQILLLLLLLTLIIMIMSPYLELGTGQSTLHKVNSLYELPTHFTDDATWTSESDTCSMLDNQWREQDFNPGFTFFVKSEISSPSAKVL